MNEKLIGTINNTTALMHKYGITAKKKYGQNFLVEPTIIQKVVEELNPDWTVIEIGTGLGSLTQAMALKVKKVIGYEIDGQLYDILCQQLEEYENIELINQDFLKADLEALLASIEGEVVIVSNLPYYITTELLFKIITEANKRVSRIIVMMQKEVADRFLKQDKGKDYNALQAIAPYYYEISLLTRVGKNNFIPAPKVDSAILKFVKRDYPVKAEDEGLLLEVIEACFSQRRKVITTNLTNRGFNIDKQQLSAINIDDKARVEQLCLEDFIALTEVVEK